MRLERNDLEIWWMKEELEGVCGISVFYLDSIWTVNGFWVV